MDQFQILLRQKNNHMKIEYQCVSLELAKQLKEAGVPQSSLYFWQEDATKEFDPRICAWHTNDGMTLEFAAFTCSELGEMLPKYITLKDEFAPRYLYISNGQSPASDGMWYVYYEFITVEDDYKVNAEAKNLVDAMAKMLKILIQSNLINPSNLK